MFQEDSFQHRGPKSYTVHKGCAFFSSISCGSHATHVHQVNEHEDPKIQAQRLNDLGTRCLAASNAGKHKKRPVHHRETENRSATQPDHSQTSHYREAVAHLSYGHYSPLIGWRSRQQCFRDKLMMERPWHQYSIYSALYVRSQPQSTLPDA